MAKKKKEKAGVMPERIFAQVSPRSIGGLSMFDALGEINVDTVDNFQSERDVIDEASNLLGKAGFEVLQVNNLTINIAGSRDKYEKAFGRTLYTEERPVIKGGAEEDEATFIDCEETSLPGLITVDGTDFEDVIEGVAIEEPNYFMAPSAYPPAEDYWHLRVPAGISLGTNADKAHRAGTTGKSIRVSMVDSGHYKHPFFTKRGYRVAPVTLGPGASDPAKDEVGHGTGESANIFAVAPDVELLPVKMSFVNSTGAFNAAVGLNPDIITCSWGSSVCSGPLSAAKQALAAAVSSAWASGIVVIFSAGNGHAGFPAQHPDTIAAGGVYMDEDGSLTTSDYSSGFMSPIYSGRRVPDLCGLVGMQPRAMYIMLPLEPGDQIDQGNSGGSHPNGDETANDDGWAAFSGTSAAAPQLAGAAALIKQSCDRLSPSQVRDVLQRTARDVTTGTTNSVCGSKQTATSGPDQATGEGLVDAYKATLLAKIRCLRRLPTRRPRPQPRRPEVGPIRRPRPEPRGPEPRPIRRRPRPEPIRPIHYELEELSLESQVEGLTDEEAEALEEMVVKSEIDLEDLE